MTTPPQCLECGAPLSAADAGGLCPKCLLRLGLASQLASGTLPASATGLTPDGVVLEPFDFGAYRILRLLGKGGMGAVYEAEHRESGRRVALKVLGQTIDSAEMRLRFIREGQLAASVRHPNVVAVFGAEEIEGAPVISMEMVADGTLRDRVKRKGPLPFGEAVDAVLQMIDGLETAHAVGVLHRDIKPANTFVARDGMVKIGDFGLSISTLSKAEAQLTQSGAVLGTPAFASPEQLRGRELDLRSDIYGVGATLYFLLTGKPTHEGEALVTLIAAVLETMPAQPSALRPELPKGLSRVVMRSLAKEPSARFATYAEFREALLPFSSSAPTPATLGLRFLAGLLDLMVVSVPSLTLLLAAGNQPMDMLLVERTPSAAAVMFGFTVFELLYFALPEGLWGATLGKALFGLKVVRMREGGVPGIWRGLARAVLVFTPEWIAGIAVALTVTPLEYTRQLSGLDLTWPDALGIGSFLLLFATLRRANGFAAVHDLLTRTRVIARQTSLDRPPLDVPRAEAPALGEARIGQYAIVSREGAHVTAWDTVLRRLVWVRTLPPGTAPMMTTRSHLNRTARLRWLGGHRSATEAWDAFEAPAGAPLTRFLDRHQPWARVRFWLHDLAEEFSAAAADATLPEPVGLDHVWLTNDGRALLLEFAAPGGLPTETRPIRDVRDQQAFLSAIASGALPPQVPLHAREFLQRLAARSFDAIEMTAGTLRSLLPRPAMFSRRRRLVSLALPTILALAFSIIAVGLIGQANRRFDAFWTRNYPGQPSLRYALELFAKDPLRPAGDLAPLAEHIAGHHRAAISDPAFWATPETIAAIDPTTAKFAREVAGNMPELSATDLARADAKIVPKLERRLQFDRRAAWILPPFMFVLFLGTFLTLGALFSPFVRAPFALWLVGAAVVTRDGAPARRGRLIARMLVVILPAATAVLAVLAVEASDYEFVLMALAGGCIALLLVAAGQGLRRPELGIPEMLTGTFLVPR